MIRKPSLPTIEQARGWYPADDPVHGFDHVLRVLRLAERLASLEGADQEIVAAAVLLHDAVVNFDNGWEIIDKCAASEQRKDHHTVSAEFAQHFLRHEGWKQARIDAVRHCIQTHRYRDPNNSPQTVEARVIFDADKLDAIGAMGAARAIAYAVKGGQPIYARPSSLFLQTGNREAGEPYSAYHEYLFKLVRIQKSLCTPSGRAMAEARQRRMVDFFEGLVLEAGE